ncbi:MAG: extracellular solute-binding protein [Verrucomicrobia bacterium]|nr:extracellular solute-binding protein [Verrucomicrobiota bacterium]
MNSIVLFLFIGLAHFVFPDRLFAAEERQVVVYCALDQPYAEPVFQSFEKETGIRVKVVYDSEAVKTAGLVNRLIAESKRPQCDVFWNNEKLRTVMLARRGLLARYDPLAWTERGLHDEKDGLWSEFAARARVLVYNRDHLRQILPREGATEPVEKRSLQAVRHELEVRDETQWLSHPPPPVKGRVAIAYPLFGTTSTHFLDWMRQQRASGTDVETWLTRVAANKPLICSGNSDVVRRVAAGDAWLGFTDSDDACAAMERDQTLDFVFPNSLNNEKGSLLIPNTIAIMRGAPHQKEAAAFVDFVLTEKTERMLAGGISKQIPLGEVIWKELGSLPFRSGSHRLGKTRRANEEELAKTMEADFELLRKAFHR